MIEENAELEHPLPSVYEYITGISPSPESEGSKVPFEMPLPIYSPPAGDPPVRTKGLAFSQMELLSVKMTAGNGLTESVNSF